MRNQRKAGVIIDGFPLTEWEKQVIRSIRNDSRIELIFLICLGRKGESSSEEETEVIDASITHDGELDSATSAYVREQSPDWILSLSRVRLRGEILDMPTWGVWTYRHYGETIPFLKNFRERSSSTSVCLDRLKHNDMVQPLREACISVRLDSYRTHMKKVESITSDWPILVSAHLEDETLMRQEEQYVPKEYSLLKGKGDIRRTEMIHRWKRLRRKLFGYEFWNVGTTTMSLKEIMEHKNLNIHWFKQRSDLYYADPFVYRDGEQWKIIMEEVDYRSVKGFITEWILRNNEVIQEEKAVLSGGSHFSYPYILYVDGELYCIPENSETEKVVLYQYRDGWKAVKTLIDHFPAVDSTLVKYQGKWWIFCTRASVYNGDNEELHIFYAEDLFGEWSPHARNPVKVDARSSRPAGTPFYHNGELYRPAQDCSHTYGGAIVLNRIRHLSETKFSEEIAARIEPDPSDLYPDGIHTLSMADGMVVVDGKRTEYHLKHFLKKAYCYRPVPLEKVLAKPLKKKSRIV
ncbi:glucosamine inositolphosphorylceramide transferase family protein [Salimicrobium halophilum]|uniref:Glucosamine inositolphosphorylceramide transferase 1 N-terminal domain-containing protein n=1 Tax=Salimicrobium halophilum TaxID=86666 RepID=A0A1G8SBA9_9BACI|nr:hypothetical protein [Salimicrobium halophilum]SDJ26491.1 hypothetical protein SAMN04490247_1360 [Salimicrobium halophilum]